MIEPNVDPRVPAILPEVLLLQNDADKYKTRHSADEKLEELMEALELSLKKFDESSESFGLLRQINKQVAALRKVSPKNTEDVLTIENYAFRVDETCQAYYKQLEEIKNAERDRILDAQKQSRLKFLAKQTGAEEKTGS